MKCSFSALTFLGTQSHTDFCCCCAWVSFWTVSIVRWRTNCALCVGMELEDNLRDWRVCQKVIKKNWHLFLSRSVWFQQEDVVPQLVFNLGRVVGTWHPSTGILSETRCWQRLVFYLRRVVGTGISVFGEFSYPQDKNGKSQYDTYKGLFWEKNAQYVKSLTLWGFFWNRRI